MVRVIVEYTLKQAYLVLVFVVSFLYILVLDTLAFCYLELSKFYLIQTVFIIFAFNIIGLYTFSLSIFRFARVAKG